MNDGFSDHLIIGPGLRCVKLARRWFGQIYDHEACVWQTVTTGFGGRGGKEAARQALSNMLHKMYHAYLADVEPLGRA